VFKHISKTFPIILITRMKKLANRYLKCLQNLREARKDIIRWTKQGQAFLKFNFLLNATVMFIPPWHCGPTRAMASSFLRFLDHSQLRITVGRTSLDEWSVRRRDFYLTTHDTHNRQTSMPPVGFEATISAGERPQMYALDRAATGIGNTKVSVI